MTEFGFVITEFGLQLTYKVNGLAFLLLLGETYQSWSLTQTPNQGRALNRQAHLVGIGHLLYPYKPVILCLFYNAIYSFVFILFANSAPKVH